MSKPPSWSRTEASQANRLIDNWDRTANPMKKGDFGVFEVVIPAKNGQPAIPHNSKITVSVFGSSVRNETS